VFIKTRLNREFGIKEKKIHVVKHGVYEVPDSISTQTTDVRKNYKLGKTDFVFLFFGYITSYKGLPLLLEAFRNANTESGMKLIIAGKVADDYKNEMDKLAEKYGSDDIQMILKFISDKEVDMLFRASNATILPYLEASQSGVLFMSYAYGKPVLAPDLGGFPYDIETGKTGYLFTAGNVESLKEQMIRLYNEWKNKKESDNNYIKEFASKNYSWQASAHQLKELYGS
jgi:glycosyltransferase involved in cell wall biosynthesis